MTTTVYQFIQKQHAEFTAFHQALTNESDRGCALFAAAFLDKALSDLLYLSLVADKRIEKDLFEGTAPLSSFSARIKLAFYLGKISKECRADLDTIRRIRNEFAHHAELISFDDQSIAGRCRNLQFSYHERTQQPRSHFTAAVSRILAMLQATGLSSVAPLVKPDDRPTETEKAEARAQAELAIQDLAKSFSSKTEAIPNASVKGASCGKPQDASYPED
ncbi:MltR family transcriptional regulator [Paludibacterium sp. B53371]|uniref:MltR family transcriptional regulator n=1 Tax=Paludibacterium sp. B53371 TaxID=2806263 RepID=UPI001C044352|nr:MltR family transcriptional regulator [Paludibacterium sp. B53371]